MRMTSLVIIGVVLVLFKREREKERDQSISTWLKSQVVF